MKFLSVDHLVQLHVLAIRTSGGSDGIRDLGRLESAVASQKQEVFGQELYKDVFEKAAAVCRGIIGDHPFIDGNKRTALLSATVLLEINGYKFIAIKGELEDFAVQVAVEHLEIPVIAAWLKSRSKKA